MTIPATNPKLSDLIAEFSAPAGTPLSAFVRGGTYVPSNVIPSTIPTALPLRLSAFAGARLAGNLSWDSAELLGDAVALTVLGSGLSREYVANLNKSSFASDVAASGTLRVRFNIGNATNPAAFLMSGPGAALNGGFYDQFSAGSFSLLLSPSAYLSGATVVDGERKDQIFADSAGSSTMSAGIGAPIGTGFDSTSREVSASVSGSQLVVDFPLDVNLHISTNDVPFGVGASVAGQMQCTFNYNVRVKDGGVTIATVPVTFDITVGVSVSAQATEA